MAGQVQKLGPLVKAGFRTILLGKCHPCKVKNACRIVIKRMEFDKNLNMFFSKNVPVIAHDPDGVCKSGDVVLIEKLDSQITRDITHRVINVVYPCGDVTDPITGKKCVAGEYRDDMERSDRLWGKNPTAFDYDKAPPRGWQEGRKDWTHKEGYRRFHEFPDNPQIEAEY